MRGMGATELLMMAIAKALIAVLLAGVVVYSVVAGITIPEPVMQLVFLVMAACFGFDARLAWCSWRVVTRRKKRG